MGNRFAAMTLAVGLALLSPFSPRPAGANVHSLSGIAHNATNNLGTLDLVVSVDWNMDAASSMNWNRSTYRNMMNAYAKNLFAATEGRHRVGRLHTYMNKQNWSRADVRIIANRSGGSAASVAKFRKDSGAVSLYLREKNGSRDGFLPAVLTHECGHYIYGVFDEYRGANYPLAADLEDKTDPASDDFNTMPSVMNDHSIYPMRFSVAANYTTEEQRKTAQWRAYGASIWDTLVRSPSRDPEPGRSWGRTRYAAFGNITAPLAVTMPTAGYGGGLRTLFMENGAVHVLAFDPALASTNWEAARQAAESVVQGLAVNSSLLAPVGVAAAIGKTTITGEAARTALATRVSGLAASGSLALKDVLTTALDNATRARAANQTAVVHLIAKGNPATDRSLNASFQSAKVALNVPALTAENKVADPESYSVAKLARDSGGAYNRARSAPELAAKAARSASDMEGANEAAIAESFAGPLASGENQTMSFAAGTHDGTDNGLVSVTYVVAPGDYARAAPTLIAPSGTVLTATTVAAGFNVVTDAAAGVRVFEITPAAFAGGVTGTWKARISATSALSDTSGILAQASSELQMSAGVRQIDGDRSPVVEAALFLDRPVLGATVVADVYAPDGTLVAERLALRDDGKGGDLRKDDGIYSLVLSNMPGNGEYDVVVTATNPDGTAIASGRGGVFANPTDDTAYAMSSFQRTAEVSASLTVPPHSADRGCVLGGPGAGWDMGIPALLAAVAGWAVRRRTRGR